MKCVFLINQSTPIEGKPSWYQCLTLRAEAPTREEAFEAIKSQIPEGKRMWCWYVDQPIKESP